MTKKYLENHGDDVVRFENVIERRLSDDTDIEELIGENERSLASCQQRELRYHLIDDSYHAGEPEVGSLSSNDLDAAAKLFCDTVHAINARDYTPEQLDAWAPHDNRRTAQIAEKLAR